MILDATTKKLQVVLGGAITSAQLQVNVSWADTQNGATFVPGSNSAVTNSATPVDIVAAPAASTQRQVKEVTVQNTDTAAATVTVQTVDGANTRKNIVVTIQVGETLFFAAGQWGVLATNGAIKGSAGVSSVAVTVPSDKSVSGSPITTTGTIAITDNNQNANTFKAGPTSGGATAPAYRTLVSADLNSLAFTTGSVPFGNASGGLSQDNSKLFWDDTHLQFTIGTQLATPPTLTGLTVNGTGSNAVTNTGGIFALYAQNGVTSSVNFNLTNYASPARVALNRYDGVPSAPTAVISGDILSDLLTRGYDTSTVNFASQIQTLADENFSPTAHGSKVVILLPPIGSTALQNTTSFFGDGRFQMIGARADLSYSKQSPTTGFSITPANTVENLILTPAGSLLAGTIIMPANPKDGQFFTACSTQVVTTLTMSPNAGQTLLGGLAAFTANGFGSWQYVASTTTWYRRG